VKTYGRNDIFDIEPGMPVFEAGGRKIGLVTDVTGFGSTYVDGSGQAEDSEPVIRAAVSTGHFGVAELLGTGPSHLRLRFADIHEVIRGHGVTLMEAAGALLEEQRIAFGQPSTITTESSGSRSRLRSLFRRKSVAGANP
jgi:hypothetical protein